ncbi:MAG: hypothetical protein ACOC1G_03845 [Phycisphaeraceae bacterium]
MFADDRQRDAMLVDLLDALLRQGALDVDGAMRAVLTPRELVGLVPWRQREQLSLASVEALCEYLQPPSSLAELNETHRAWRSTLEATRRELRWRDLPPVIERSTRLHAETLLAYAEGRGWLGRLELSDKVMWKLSPAGGDALVELRRRLTETPA